MIKIVLPVSQVEEQTEIICHVESLFAYAGRLEARYTAARTQVEKLTPALLAKAFRGELVPQDPHDLPASELLARIKAERIDVAAKPRKSSTGNKLLPVENDRKGKDIAAGGIE